MSAVENARALIAGALECPADSIADDAAMPDLPDWDSLAHLRLVIAIEERRGRALSIEEVLSIDGIAAVTALLTPPP